MKKLTTVATLLMGLMAGAQAQADTRIGVTVYKYDDNFMAVVRKAIEKEFGVKIPPSEIDLHLESVQTLAQYVAEQRKA